jgi:hypothetical protein
MSSEQSVNRIRKKPNCENPIASGTFLNSLDMTVGDAISEERKNILRNFLAFEGVVCKFNCKQKEKNT